MIIVGAALAGGNAAVTLRDEGYRGRVVLIGDEPTIPFGRPPLSKSYLAGTEDLAGWYVKPTEWYEANNVELMRKVRVASIDINAHQIRLAGDETVGYEGLLLATGGRNRRLALPGVELPGVYQLRALAECDAIKAEATAGRRAVVVGLGFIGSEVTASLTSRGVNVTAIGSGSGPLSAVLGDECGQVMARIHRDKGVELVLNDQASTLLGDGYVDAVITKSGRRLPCDFVVIGAGIAPNVELAAEGGLAVDNGILVDASCHTSVESVVAAGDVANHLHPLFGRIRVEHYNNAERMGRAAARAMLGSHDAYDDVHTFWSDQYEDKIEYVGAVHRWDQFVVRGSLDDRRFIGFYLSEGRLRAAVGLNRGGDPELDENDEMAACRHLVATGGDVDPALLVDDRVDLRELAAAAPR